MLSRHLLWLAAACLFFITLVQASEVHQEGYCVMRQNCGSKKMFGRQLPCPDNGPAVEPDAELRALLVKTCGDSFADSRTCCDQDQLQNLVESTKQAAPILSACPACWTNFLNFFCTFTCSPNQSTFLNVTKTMISSDKKDIVTEVDFLVSDQYGSGFFESCKEVKFGSTNDYAMGFIGNNSKEWRGMVEFMGHESDLGSPFQINFPVADPSQVLTPFSGETKRCNDSDVRYGCTCVDCLQVCPVLPPTPEEKPPCTVFGISCWSFSLSFIYTVTLASAIGMLVIRKRIALAKDLIGFEPVPMHDDDDDDENNQHLLDPDQHSSRYFVSAVLQEWFYHQGYLCAKHAWRTIGISFGIVAFFSLGWSRFGIETDPVKLWVAPDSISASQKAIFDQNFGPFYRTAQVIVSYKDVDTTIVDKESFKRLFMMNDQIKALKTEENGITLQDICFHPTGDDCIIQSSTGYWQDDYSNFPADEDDWKDQFISCAAHPANCLPTFQQPLKPELVLGGFEGDDYGEARAFVITYVIQNSVDPEVVNRAHEWELGFLKYMERLENGEIADISTEDLRISYSSESSLEIELNKSSNTDIRTVILSYLVMFLYASLALGRFSSFVSPKRIMIDSKFTLGLSGIFIVLASISTSVGIFSFLGYKITLIIAEVIPFLVLAVGVDNIFILCHEFERRKMNHPDESIEECAGRTLGRMGPSILLSALSETIAFGLGGMVTMPAVSVFAMYAAMAVWVDFLLQVTAFVSCIALDAQRTEEDRLDCFPCIQINAPQAMDEEALLPSWVRKYYGPLILNSTVKKMIVAFFLGLFTLGLCLLPSLEIGLDQRLALPRDSYMVQFFNDLDTYFKVGPPVYFVVQDVDVLTREGQQKLCGRFTTCHSSSMANTLELERKRPEVSYIEQPAAVWIDDYMHWLNPAADSCCRYMKKNPLKHCEFWDDEEDCDICLADQDPSWNITLQGLPEGDLFLSYLEKWLVADPDEFCPLAGKAAYGDAVKLNSNRDKIQMSHFRTYHTPMRNQHDFIAGYKSAHRIAATVSQETGSTVFPYSVFYIFFEQYIGIVSLTVRLLGVAIVAVGLVTAVVLGSPKVALVVVVVVCMIMVNVVGAMVLFGVSLNAISLVNLVIAVGISVEFCSHIARASVEAEGSPDERVFGALVEVGSSVFSGITLTKFLGIFVLAFTRSKIFEVYYFRMYLAIVVVGAIHGLVLLPVLLSLVEDKKLYTLASHSRWTGMSHSRRRNGAPRNSSGGGGARRNGGGGRNGRRRNGGNGGAEGRLLHAEDSSGAEDDVEEIEVPRSQNGSVSSGPPQNSRGGRRR